MAATPKAGNPYPGTATAPNGPQQFQDLAIALEHVGRNYATASARDLAYASPAVPATGDKCTVAGVQQVYAAGQWNTILDDSPPWVNIAALGPNFGNVINPQARVFNGWVELRGIIRHASGIGTAFVQMTSSGNAAITQVSPSYSAANIGTGGPTATANGLDSNFAPTAANLAITARTNGSLYIAAAATGALYVNLADVRFPTA